MHFCSASPFSTVDGDLPLGFLLFNPLPSLALRFRLCRSSASGLNSPFMTSTSLGCPGHPAEHFDIPFAYTVDKLHELAPLFWKDASSSNCTIRSSLLPFLSCPSLTSDV